MSHSLKATMLTQGNFAAFGDIIEAKTTPDMMINQGLCGRHHDMAHLDFTDGRAGLSLFDAQARHLPHRVDMVERHPLGSQAFIPLSGAQMLVVVAQDQDGTPVKLQAFLSQPGQSINLRRNIWHGVLAPFEQPGQFVVVDRIGDGNNLQEHWFDTAYVIDEIA